MFRKFVLHVDSRCYFQGEDKLTHEIRDEENELKKWGRCKINTLPWHFVWLIGRVWCWVSRKFIKLWLGKGDVCLGGILFWVYVCMYMSIYVCMRHGNSDLNEKIKCIWSEISMRLKTKESNASRVSRWRINYLDMR